MDDMLAEQFTGLKSGKKPTHRGHRSRGKGPKVNPDADHHETAKSHLANAQSSSDPMTTKLHLFKALSSLKKC